MAGGVAGSTGAVASRRGLAGHRLGGIQDDAHGRLSVATAAPVDRGEAFGECVV